MCVTGLLLKAIRITEKRRREMRGRIREARQLGERSREKTAQARHDHLRDGLADDDVLIANLRLTDERKDHEVGFVVLMPDVGVVTLEVKGGSVWWDGGWRTMRRGHEAAIRPVDQARDGKYALRGYVEHDQRWGSRTRVACGGSAAAERDIG